MTLYVKKEIGSGDDLWEVFKSEGAGDAYTSEGFDMIVEYYYNESEEEVNASQIMSEFKELGLDWGGDLLDYVENEGFLISEIASSLPSRLTFSVHDFRSYGLDDAFEDYVIRSGYADEDYDPDVFITDGSTLSEFFVDNFTAREFLSFLEGVYSGVDWDGIEKLIVDLAHEDYDVIGVGHNTLVIRE